MLRNGHALNIEIKPTPGQEDETGRVVAREAAQLWQGRSPPPLLSSFEAASLVAARRAAPELPRALLLDALPADWFDLAVSLDCVAVVTAYPLMTSAVIARLHGAALRALCYTVNDPAEAHRLLGLGIDGIITDALDRFSPGAAADGVLD